MLSEAKHPWLVRGRRVADADKITPQRPKIRAIRRFDTLTPGIPMAGPSKTSRYLRLSSVGLELGAAVIIGLWGGQWLDTKFGTTPWLMLLGLAFGMAAGFRSIFRLLKDANRPAEDDDTKKS